MSVRTGHKFEFQANEIAEAAKDEAIWHEGRLAHWQERRDKALEIVKGTIGAEVVERQQTDGPRADVVVHHGDPDAWAEYSLAYRKVNEHREAAKRYWTDERVYRTQGQRPYELDTDDVHHFRLGEEARNGTPD